MAKKLEKMPRPKKRGMTQDEHTYFCTEYWAAQREKERIQRRVCQLMDKVLDTALHPDMDGIKQELSDEKDKLRKFNFDVRERTWEVKVEATTTREVIVHADTEYEAQIKAQIEMVSLVGGENTKVLAVKETTDD